MSKVLLLESPLRNYDNYLEAVADLDFIGWRTNIRELFELGIRAVQRARTDKQELVKCAEAFLREGLLYDVRGSQEEELMVMTMVAVFLMVHRDIGRTILAEGLSACEVRVQRYDEHNLILRVV